MHPQIVSHEPGLCPICQMQLQRVDEVPGKSDAKRGDAGVFEGGEAAAGGVPGHAPFDLSTERQQLIGVTRAAVAPRALQVDVRATGRVAYDPELYQAVVEYREALRSRGRIGTGSLPEARTGADSLVGAVKLKLRQQGLSASQIDALARAERDPVELLLPGEAVWVYAQVFEHEAGLVAPGQAMSITAPSRPGRTYSAKLAAVDAILDPTTRTLRVRALVPTPGADLRPESFVDVKIHVPLGEKLAIPEEAVLDTGEHQIVFVVKGEGRFEPRSVTLGQDAQAADAQGDLQGYYEVLAGLQAGEEVVTSANFLIDSESRFRAALAAFRRPSHGRDQGAAPHRH
jgi:membrane fusion protein, copper/silver efflux system